MQTERGINSTNERHKGTLFDGSLTPLSPYKTSDFGGESQKQNVTSQKCELPHAMRIQSRCDDDDDNDNNNNNNNTGAPSHRCQHPASEVPFQRGDLSAAPPCSAAALEAFTGVNLTRHAR